MSPILGTLINEFTRANSKISRRQKSLRMSKSGLLSSWRGLTRLRQDLAKALTANKISTELQKLKDIEIRINRYKIQGTYSDILFTVFLDIAIYAALTLLKD